jgi:hypothetical protein
MVYDTDEGDNYARAIQAGLLDMFEVDLVETVFSGAFTKQGRARAPYKDTWMDAENGISIYASPNLSHSTIEISGSGCEHLIELGVISGVLDRCYERITRIDVATDIETDTLPSEFVAVLSHERMRAAGYQHSVTGETNYVGSKKSDRYARVYRYFEPHPRSHLLRIEHVFRREYAKVVAQSLLDNSLESVAAAAGKAFGWAHIDWKPEAAEHADISIIAAERGQSSTVRWLLTSCAPAFKRLVADGTIRDAEEFLRVYFLTGETYA